MQAFAWRQGQMRGSAEQVAFLRGEGVLVLVGFDGAVTLFRGQSAESANRLVNGLAALGRQLLELLKDLAGLLFLAGCHVLPDFHAVEDALLLLGRQAGKVLQPVLHPHLLLRRKLAEIRIVLKFASLLFRRQIAVMAEPVSGVAGPL